ncbi:NAD(P)-binding protein [Lojkania enalia]|uniref:NAD(P)-binding protein n=1 Tax=Lojkania enalia TaxID=147567 RepID=A0A9P4N792_9PLEO|nr:NAD(P)-binding protein [Didymosphaeria enalia]
MPLTILTDEDIRTLLLGLTKGDILDLQQSLADALHYYSTTTEEEANGCCSLLQPLRTALKRTDGQTTLFMPASSNDGLGIKVVTLSKPDSKEKPASESSLKSFDSTSLSTQSSPQYTNDNVPSPSITSSLSTTPKGTLTLLDKAGHPLAFINAEELTAFRTALASTMLFKKRVNVHDVTVFGAGKQAYWHIRLALLLRGPEIHHLNIINRSFSTAQSLLTRLYDPSSAPTTYPSLGTLENATPTPSQNDLALGLARPKIQILTPSHTEYTRLLKTTIRHSSALFCTTPSTSPLFPASYLTNPEGRKKGRYISLIGSYAPHMLEVDPEIIRQAVARPEGGQGRHWHHHGHRHAGGGSVVVVDSLEACLKEAGELIQAGVRSDQVVEVGELVMLKRDAERRRAERAERAERAKQRSLMEWLQAGNVIYKSVGIGLMDVVVGNELVRLAGERGIGTRIDNF